MNQEESVYELNRIQRYIMQMRPLLKKNALFSDGTADYRQPISTLSRPVRKRDRKSTV